MLISLQIDLSHPGHHPWLFSLFLQTATTKHVLEEIARVASYPAMHYDGVCFSGDKRGQAPPHLSLRSESTSRETREKEKKNGHLFSSILQGVCLSGMLLRITNLRQEDSAGNKKVKQKQY